MHLSGETETSSSIGGGGAALSEAGSEAATEVAAHGTDDIPTANNPAANTANPLAKEVEKAGKGVSLKTAAAPAVSSPVSGEDSPRERSADSESLAFSPLSLMGEEEGSAPPDSSVSPSFAAGTSSCAPVMAVDVSSVLEVSESVVEDALDGEGSHSESLEASKEELEDPPTDDAELTDESFELPITAEQASQLEALAAAEHHRSQPRRRAQEFLINL